MNSLNKGAEYGLKDKKNTASIKKEDGLHIQPFSCGTIFYKRKMDRLLRYVDYAKQFG